MERIRINTTKEYDCLIGEEVFKEAIPFLPKGGKKAAIIWDENVGVKIVSKLGALLETRGMEVIALSVEGGENLKSLTSYEKIIKYLIDFNLDRDDFIYAIGGGSVGDMAGFIASTYKRGIKLIQVPTTLLAACDSSVGGKTALNIGGIKNVIGTFYQPDLVLIDPLMFNTLSDDIFKEGIGEIIKYGMIGDSELLELLYEEPLTKKRDNYKYITSIIFRVLGIKAKIVEEDEFDNGVRNILNFGHTLAHAIEAESDFTIPHGQAVAMGMNLITKAAENARIAEIGTEMTLVDALEKNEIDFECPYDIENLLKRIETDKKVRGNIINVVLPREAGKCFVKSMTLDEFRNLFNE